MGIARYTTPIGRNPIEGDICPNLINSTATVKPRVRRINRNVILRQFANILSTLLACLLFTPSTNIETFICALLLVAIDAPRKVSQTNKYRASSSDHDKDCFRTYLKITWEKIKNTMQDKVTNSTLSNTLFETSLNL
ncbi:hypothetical protein ES708_02995 [subsurface metagenome]